MRLGGAMIAPMIQMANFSMIAFLYIREALPIEIFAPLFIISGFMILSVIGNHFRKHQTSTDHQMIFEKQTQYAKVMYEIMKTQRFLMEKNQAKTSIGFNDTVEYLRKISEGEKI